MAEIITSDGFGVAMGKCIKRYAIRKILENGAFDGDGATQVIAAALATKEGDKILASLEEKLERFHNQVATRDYSIASLTADSCCSIRRSYLPAAPKSVRCENQVLRALLVIRCGIMGSLFAFFNGLLINILYIANGTTTQKYI
jgi:hypothetical protein